MVGEQNKLRITSTGYNERGQLTTINRASPSLADTTYSYYPAGGSGGNESYRLQQIQSSNLLNLSYQYDPLGNISQINDNIMADSQTFSALAYGNGGQTGQKVPGSSASYYPFGSPRATPTQTITDRNFTGQKENLELGLIYYNARYYLPGSGRFLTPDTLIPRPTDPQSFNRYAYTRNNPTGFTDSSGHVCYDYDPITDAATPGCTQPSPKELAGALVSFQVAENVDGVWTAVEKAVIYQAAYDVGKAFANNINARMRVRLSQDGRFRHLSIWAIRPIYGRCSTWSGE